MSNIKEKIFKKILLLEAQFPEFIARLYIVIGAFISVLSTSLVKSSTLSVGQTLFFRGILIIIFNFETTTESLYVQAPNIRSILLVQSFLRAFQAILFYAAVKLVSVSEATVLFLTSTLWAQIGARIILDEPLRYSAIRNSFLSIVGVVLITQPSQIFGKDLESIMDNNYWGFALALGSGLVYAISSVLIKTLGQSVSSITILQYYHFWCIIIGSIMMVITQEADIDMYSFQNLQCMLLIFAFSFIYQSCEIRGFLLVSVAKLAPFTFTNVLFSLLSDIIFYSTIPNFSSIIGSSMIVLPLVLKS